MRKDRFILAAAAVLAASCASGPMAPRDPNVAFREWQGEFVKDVMAFYPEWAIQAGDFTHATDLTIPDAERRKRELKLLDRETRELARFDPAALEPQLRADHALIDNFLKETRWAQGSLREWEWNPALSQPDGLNHLDYNPATAIDVLLNTEYAPLDERLRAVSARLAKVPELYEAVRQNLKKPVREYTQLAIKQHQGGLELLSDSLLAKVDVSGLSASEKDEFRHRVVAARAAVQGYVAYLTQLEPALTPDDSRSFRLGRELYEQKFAFEIQSGFTPEQLYQRALAAKERLLKDMEARSRQLWPKYFGGGRKAIPMPADRHALIAAMVEKVSEQHSKAESFEADVRALVPRLASFVSARQLVDLDPSRPLIVRPTPPYNAMRGVAIASIDPPGPFNATAATYFNVNPMSDFTPERQEGFLREYNRWMMQIFAIHEAVPGHYVQLLHANRSPSYVKALLSSTPMVEGWAVYSERMMVEQGWDDGEPEIWLMLDKFQLRSTCNTILDYSVHVLDLSEDDALKLLMNDAFQTETEARGKWRRVQLSNVQLTSYFAGFSEIYEFREQQREMLGAKFDLRAFHNRFLSYGSVPVKVIKQLMMEPEAPQK